MSELLKKLSETHITRRGFMASAVAASVMAGCSRNDTAEIYYGGDNDNGPVPELFADEELPGCFMNNCGGSCQSILNVRGRMVDEQGNIINNGRIVRITTDEHPEYNYIDGAPYLYDDVQRRSCLRCRAKKFWLQNRNDRITTALKQTGKRGDLHTFAAIPLDLALEEIGKKLGVVKNKYGSEAITIAHSTGDIGSGQNMSHLGYLMNHTGGAQFYRFSMSFAGFECTVPYFWGQDKMFPYGAGREGIFKTEHIVFWSSNLTESIQGTNTTWYISQAKEMGVEISVVDQRASQSALTYAKKEDRYMPLQGTDTAMLHAMMYHLIMLEWGNASKVTDLTRPTDGWLNELFIRKYVHGFFDTDLTDLAGVDAPYAVASTNHFSAPNTPLTKKYDGDLSVHVVADGASLSAYILGNDNTLVSEGINKATSIYPDTIGYNLRAPGTLNDSSKGITDPGDKAYGKRAPIYGQVPKTPEWAEKICGVPADNIRRLAERIAAKKTYMVSGLGYNRAYEAEQAVLSFLTLSVITGCFGTEDRAHAMLTEMTTGETISATPAIMRATNSLPVAAWNTYYRIREKRFNEKLMSPELKDVDDFLLPDYYKRNCNCSDTTTSFPLPYMQDVIQYGGTGKSKWGDHQVANGPKIRAILNPAGNWVMNQGPDVSMMRKVLRESETLELFAVWDFFMTPTAQYADYILPAAFPVEKTKFYPRHVMGQSILGSIKNFEPEGDAKAEWETWDKMLTAMEAVDNKTDEGIGSISSDYNKSYDSNYDKLYNDAVRVKLNIRDNESLHWDYFYPEFKTNEETRQGRKVPTAEEFRKTGRYYITENKKAAPPFAAFRTDPELNALKTPSGRFECYSRLMIENYEARGYYNFDTNIDNKYGAAPAFSMELVKSGSNEPQIMTGLCNYQVDSVTGKLAKDASGNYIPANATEITENAKRIRFAYPIPMYIPAIEGKHACDGDASIPEFSQTNPTITVGAADHGATQHPDVYEYKNKYPYTLVSFHGWIRAHSTNDNSPYINEIFKRDKDGNPAFLNPQRETLVPSEVDGTLVPPAWDDNVYEPVFVHPENDHGIEHGDKIIVYNDRGAIYASAVHTRQMRKDVIMMAQGSWACFDDDGVDYGGSMNTLTTARGSRIGQGNTVTGDNRVMIAKADTIDLSTLECLRRVI